MTDDQDAATVRRALSWTFLIAFFLFSSTARSVYFVHGANPSARFEAVCAVAFVTFLWYWLSEECRPHRAAFPLDMPLFAAALWFVFVPYYLWRFQRWRGALKLLALGGAYGLCYAVSVAVYYALVWADE